MENLISIIRNIRPSIKTLVFFAIPAILLIGSIVSLDDFQYPGFQNSLSDIPKNLIDQQDFQNYLNTYDKKYKEKHEYKARFNTYKEAMEFIRDFNAQNKSFKLGSNQFTDITQKEFMNLFSNLAMYQIQDYKENQFKGSGKIPDKVNWVQLGAVTEVEDQGYNCRSGWAFSAIGAIESAQFIAGNSLEKLSKQQLIDCSSQYRNHGCNGGLPVNAFKYAKHYNIVSESEYPYIGKNGQCQISEQDDQQGFIETYYDESGKETDLLRRVSQQPVSAGVEAHSPMWQYYKSGVIQYNTGACGYTIDHDVLIVGYDLKAKIPYWLVKNSWGTKWGEKGYIKMEIAGGGSGTCGINLFAHYPIIY